MTTLGEVLLRHGWITSSDLERAQQSQRMMGGGLGTCLLELGVVSEDLLARAVGEVQGLEPAEVEDLRSVPEEVVALVPKKLALRCRVVPIRSTASKMHLAMLDPNDLACQDELAFATSRRLVLHAVTEARLREALERYYGEPCDSRFTRLLDRLNRARYLWQENGDGSGDGGGNGKAAAGGEAVDALFPEAPRLTPPELPIFSDSGGLDTRPSAATAKTAAEPASAPPAAPSLQRRAVQVSESERNHLYGGNEPTPHSFAEVEVALAEAADRDEVGRLVVAFLRQEFDRVVLFGVHRNTVLGWLSRGEGLESERLAGFQLVLDQPSVFYNLAHGAALHLGPLPPMKAHRPLIDLLGGESPRECLLLPVRIGDRLVAAVYGDRGGSSLGGLDLDHLRRLMHAASSALERCILLKRQGQAGD